MGLFADFLRAIVCLCLCGMHVFVCVSVCGGARLGLRQRVTFISYLLIDGGLRLRSLRVCPRPFSEV